MQSEETERLGEPHLGWSSSGVSVSMPHSDDPHSVSPGWGGGRGAKTGQRVIWENPEVVAENLGKVRVLECPSLQTLFTAAPLTCAQSLQLKV